MIIKVKGVPLTIQFPDWVQHTEAQEIIDFLENGEAIMAEQRQTIARMIVEAKDEPA